MKSIIQANEKICYLCAELEDDYTEKQTEKHHIFGGPDRKLSEKYGLTVRLCIGCHRTNIDAVHKSARTMRYLHEIGEEAYIREWIKRNGGDRQQAIESFRSVFRKNYVEE